VVCCEKKKRNDKVLGNVAKTYHWMQKSWDWTVKNPLTGLLDLYNMVQEIHGRWTQDIGDTLGMTIHEAGRLAGDRESFCRAVKRATFCKGPATWWWWWWWWYRQYILWRLYPVPLSFSLKFNKILSLRWHHRDEL